MFPVSRWERGRKEEAVIAGSRAKHCTSRIQIVQVILLSCLVLESAGEQEGWHYGVVSSCVLDAASVFVPGWSNLLNKGLEQKF